ncbi:MAG TPA: aminomethyl-transferring glycine dehydrogenase subunit GcvPA [bacterium]
MKPHPYLPHTDDEIQEMLGEIGVNSISELFNSIKKTLQETERLKLPEPLSEHKLIKEMLFICKKNNTGVNSFLGAGAYNHFIPAVVPALLQRSEFLTPYTPYQPELSQGTLQAIFEFQSMIADLFRMEIANASMYDGATALAEAALMCMRIKGTKKVAVSKTVHPEYRAVLKTYINALDESLIEIPYNQEGITDFSAAERLCGEGVSAILIQNPNFFGCIEPAENFSALSHTIGALSVVSVAEPISLGILKPPGAAEADIVAGEGQPFGIPLSFGGPFLGLFATRKEFLRQMPGRLAGQTVDRNGKTGYVLTIATREQHIKRERATSNICTNQSLCGIAAGIYLSAMGKTGLRDLAKINLAKAEYAKKRFKKIKGIHLKFSSPTFNEFVIEIKSNADNAAKKLQKKGILPGLPLGRYYPELKNCLLVAVTEMNSKKDIDILAKELARI